jgi:hypothetical protein
MVKLTTRDRRILGKCADAQWLTTSQIHALFFKDKTLDAVRKRLRKLVEANYLKAVQTRCFIDSFHTLDDAGIKLLRVSRPGIQLHRTVPDHLEHLTAINDVRIAVEASGVKLRFFYAHWELSALRWKYPVIPDAAFSVVTDRTSTCMVEIDRGTELSKDIQRKFEGYATVALTFPFDAVILLTLSPKGRTRSERLWTKTEKPFAILLGTHQDMQKDGMWRMQFRHLGNGTRSGSLLTLCEEHASGEEE